jgi:hypothetical protein
VEKDLEYWKSWASKAEIIEIMRSVNGPWGASIEYRQYCSLCHSEACIKENIYHEPGCPLDPYVDQEQGE